MRKELKMIDIQLNDRKFTVTCLESEENDIFLSANYLNSKLKEIREAGKITGMENMALMVALNVVHELLTTRSGKMDFVNIREALLRMQSDIDAVLSEQT